MVVFLPRDWGEAVPAGFGAGSRCDQYSVNGVREALSKGARLFLIGADALAETSGWRIAGDHLALFGTGDLAGRNRDDLGPRFPNLRGMYVVPGSVDSPVTVMRVPDIRLSTSAELRGFPCEALVSSGLDLAVTAAHGGAKVVFALRCHGPGERFNDDFSFLEKVIQEIEGGEE